MSSLTIQYPRRRVIRTILHTFSGMIFRTIADIQVIGRENLPKRGPLIVVTNHFSFLDPALLIGVTPWPLEILAGFRMPNAPLWATIFPRLWGTLAVFRGGNSRRALQTAENVLKQGGIVGIYPEASASAAVLRSARPGAAFLAARTGAPVLPIGLDGMIDVFPRLKRWQRARVTMRIGSTIGPFSPAEGSEQREHLTSIGHTIMGSIAELIPPERRGRYADDQALRASATAVDTYPWDNEPEK
ncbi:MAG: lysophospholipid acyltransferase family protein [Anaerolineae bacterium]